MARVYQKKSPYQKKDESNRQYYIVSMIVVFFFWGMWMWNIFSGGNFLHGHGASLVFVLAAISIVVARYFKKYADIARAGRDGEKEGISALESLPDAYRIFTNVDAGGYLISTVVVGPTGVFIILVKHQNGTIVPSQDSDWKQMKTGRGGGQYTVSMRNPLRQLKGEIYHLKNYLQHDYGIRIWLDGMVYFSNPDCDVKGGGSVQHYSQFAEEIRSFIVDYPARQQLSPKSVEKLTGILM